jgi:hypothetical protein
MFIFSLEFKDELTVGIKIVVFTCVTKIKSLLLQTFSYIKNRKLVINSNSKQQNAKNED